ncbi:MAG: hypothetical protein K9M54_02700 [Kiritimatiellales bacterium]|nr:hypothetical protein [Kiritimatiellales bacterium]
MFRNCHSAVLLAGILMADPAGATQEDLFRNPPPEFRPLIMQHDKPIRDSGALDYLRVRRAGGFVMDAGGSKTPSGRDVSDEETFINPTYLNVPENFKRLATVLQQLKSDGRGAWLYDEYAYPSGSAGGLVLADGHDEYAAQVVRFRVFKKGEQVVPKSDAVVVSCVALPMQDSVVDLSRAQDLTNEARRGSFLCDVPDEAWRVCLLEKDYSDTWKRHNMGRRLLNVLDRDAVGRFIAITHQKYVEELGSGLRNVQAFFTDEPQFGSAEFWGKSGLEEADPMIQWTDELLAAFEKKKGYGLVPILPALFMDAGPQTAKYRYDFYDVQSDLMAENYFGQIQTWCNGHGILSSGHMLLEESLLFHVMFSGSAFKNWMRQDLPGMDLLGAMPYRSMAFHWEPKSAWSTEDISCKMVSSMAHLQGRKGAFSENFATAEKASLRDVLGTVAWQYSEGITHMATYTIQNTLSAEDYAKFCDFCGRLALFARRGVPGSRIAVLVPESSVWAAYVPPSGGGFERYFKDNPAATEIDAGFRKTCETLLAAQKQFECVTDELLRQATVRDGYLMIGPMKFSMLILPEVRFAGPGILEKLSEFVASGGYVQFVGALPSQDGKTGQSAKVALEAEKLIRSNPGHVSKEPKVSLPWIEHNCLDDVVWSGDSAVRMLVKNDGDETIIILANPSTDPAKGRLGVAAGRKAELWNPETGETSPLNGSALEIELQQKTACVVTLR